MRSERRATTILDAARALVGAGISLIPIGTDKEPAFSVLPRVWDEKANKSKPKWEPFQDALPTDDDLVHWFAAGDYGMAAVGGKVSGNLECLDFDHAPTYELFVEQLKHLDCLDILEKCVIVETPSGGRHLWYRCPGIVIPRNGKIAHPADKSVNDGEALIETRGTKGYAVLPGSPASCHELNKPYKYVNKGLSKVSEITPEEREVMHALARSFDQKPKPKQEANPAPQGGGLSPADDYDLRGPDWSELLIGATEFSTGKWTRPGKDRGLSATTGHCKGKRGEELLFVFSSNWHPFEPMRSYGKAQVYRLLHCDGDGSRAWRELRAKGFGAPRSEPAPSAKPKPEYDPSLPRDAQTDRLPEPVVKEIPWDTPIPLTDASEEPMPFPLHIFPCQLADLCLDVARAVSDCAPDYGATAALGIMAGSIGNRFVLEVKPRYKEISTLWLCVVASPGSGKTPSGGVFMEPLRELQAEAHQRSEPNIWLQDFTMESIAPLMQDNSYGEFVYCDELAGWIGSMNAYRSGLGRDRENYLSIWSGEAITVNRKNPDAPKMYIAHPSLNIYGSTQPAKLDIIRNCVNDGFMDRILFAYPSERGIGEETWITPNMQLVKSWGEAIGRVRSVEMNLSNRGIRYPKFLKLDQPGQEVWETWTKWVKDQSIGPNADPIMHGVLAKMRGYMARMALVLHVIHDAYELPVNGTHVGEESMLRAVDLAKYFLAHARRVYRSSGRDPRIKAAQAVLNWILAKSQSVVRRAEMWASLRRNSLFSKIEDLYPAIKLLSMSGYLRFQDAGFNGMGRRPSDTYEINPSLLSESSPFNPRKSDGGNATV